MPHRQSASCVVLLVASAFALMAVSRPSAAATGQELCFKARDLAAAKYASCHRKALGLLAGGSLEFGNAFQDAVRKCRSKYGRTWPQLQNKYPGTTCAVARFDDNGDGSVTDHLTGLVWEKKTDDGTTHDKDNFYNVTAGGPGGTTNDGTQFSAFLEVLNGAPCFTSNCDWRLPTLAELNTIVTEDCTMSPCVDEGFFGPTLGARYVTSTVQLDAGFPNDETFVWGILFDIDWSYGASKSNNSLVRVVRGGL